TGGAGYTQLFRDGTIEAVCSAGGTDQQTGSPVVFGHAVESNLIAGLERYKGALNVLGLGPPLAFGIALTGVQGAEIEPGFRAYRRQTKTIDRDVVVIPEVVL